MPDRPLSRHDLEHVLHHASAPFEALREARLFITGGTGFFGHWLLESLLFANRERQLHVSVTLLTRSAERFRSSSPHIAEDPAVTLLEGDVRTIALPALAFTHVIHAATDSTGAQANMPAYALAEAILAGTRNILEQVRTGGPRLLYVSTGAVYGRSTPLPFVPESFLGGPDPLQLGSSYDEAKRMAEHLCVAYAHDTAMQPVIARCFAFVGPHLPLDAHFAIGNFIGAAFERKAIHIRGDGTPRRSWLYMADLAVWLWTLLTHGASGRAYNVGSDEAYSLAEAATLTAVTLAPGLPVQIDGTPIPGVLPNSYVPSIERAQTELGLAVRIPLSEALERTAAWHRLQRSDTR